MKDFYMPQSVIAAYEVVELWEENQRLNAQLEELREYKQKYHAELDAGVKHGEQMMAGWLKLIMSDRIKFEPSVETQESKS